MKRIAALLFIASCAVVCMGQSPTLSSVQHNHLSLNDGCDQTCMNIAAVNRNSVMLELAFESYQTETCGFSWTFPKGVDPVRSAGFTFKKNRDGTITAWSACNPKFKRKS